MEGTRPLSELHSVDWASLRHAYGSAADVPGLIQRLASTDFEVVKEAEHELWCAILHDGQVYEATGPALPFVLGVLRASDCARREPLIGWLTDLKWVFDPAHEQLVVCLVRSALYGALSTILELLDDPSPVARSEVVGFLGHAVAQAERAADGLLRHLRGESSVAVQADIRMSLANLRVRSSELDALNREWIAAPDAFRQIAARSARLHVQPDPDSVGCLAAKLPHGVDGPETWWGIGGTWSIVELLTARRGWSEDSALRAKIVETLLSLRGFIAGNVLQTVLVELFPDGTASVPEYARDLTLVQTDLLSSLAEIPEFWERRSGPATIIEDSQRAMRTFDLPTDGQLLARWLAGEARARCKRR